MIPQPPRGDMLGEGAEFNREIREMDEQGKGALHSPFRHNKRTVKIVLN